MPKGVPTIRRPGDKDQRRTLPDGPADRAIPRSDPISRTLLGRGPQARSGRRRVNTALAISYYKKARYADSEKLLRKALERATAGYTSPKDGEPFYYLGLVLKAQGNFDEAYANLYKSTWSAAWRSPGYFEVAQIASIRGDTGAALKFVDSALEANALNIRALALKSALLRAAGRPQEALALAPRSTGSIPWMSGPWKSNGWRAMPRSRGSCPPPCATSPTQAWRRRPSSWMPACGKTARPSLSRRSRPRRISPKSRRSSTTALAISPARWTRRRNRPGTLQLAARAPTDYVFPFQREMIEVLEQAMAANPADARAPYYLGNLLYDWQPQEAVALWEKSAAAGADFPVVYRNLAMVYRQQNAPREKIFAILEKGAQMGGNARILAELDQMYVENGLSPEKRLSLIEQNKPLIDRDDIVVREINLQILAGRYDNAIALIKSRLFRAWEGGPGKASAIHGSTPCSAAAVKTWQTSGIRRPWRISRQPGHSPTISPRRQPARTGPTGARSGTGLASHMTAWATGAARSRRGANRAATRRILRHRLADGAAPGQAPRSERASGSRSPIPTTRPCPF